MPATSIHVDPPSVDAWYALIGAPPVAPAVKETDNVVFDPVIEVIVGARGGPDGSASTAALCALSPTPLIAFRRTG